MAIAKQVAQMEHEHVQLVQLVAALARDRYGAGLKSWRSPKDPDDWFIGDGTASLVSDVPLPRDLASTIICLAQGITVSGRY